MAMDFISPLVEPVVTLLFNPLKRQIGYLVKARANVQDMGNRLEDLKALRADLQREVEDGKRERKEASNVVNRWLDKVGEMEAQVEATRNKYEARPCLLFPNCSINCWLVYRCGRKAAKLKEEMSLLEVERNSLSADRITRPQSSGHGVAQPMEHALFGVKENTEELQGYLKDDSIRIIGIWGMGGVGKTTLLKKVHNSLLEKDKLGFEYLIWVTVTKECKLEKLQGSVAKELGLPLGDVDDDKAKARVIYTYLKGRDFLLLLDDVWELIKLVEVGIPDISTDDGKMTRQKVILTTRSEAVCGQFRADKIIKVNCLNKGDSKDLFMKSLGKKDQALIQQVHELGLIEGIVNECAGLPLALTVIAHTMAAKKTTLQWEDALRDLRSRANLDVESLDMFHRLKFSYDNLKSDALRYCFLHCSLWPEDEEIRCVDIIWFCLGNNLIKFDFESMGEAYDKGHCLIEDLKGACLLEEVKYAGVKMHDVLRDLALWIASDCGENPNKWVVKPRSRLRQVPNIGGVGSLKETEVFSLMYNKIEELKDISYECPNISILLLSYNGELRKIHSGFLRNMHNLTYLDLSNTHISELPESISVLRRLKCLLLEGTSKLEYIGEGVISSLQELEVLDLKGSGVCQYIEDCDDSIGKGNRASGREEFLLEEVVEKPPKDDERGRHSRMSEREKCLVEELEEASVSGQLKVLSGISVHSENVLKRLNLLSHTVSISKLWISCRMEGCGTLQIQHSIWRSLQVLGLYYCEVEVVEFAGVEEEGERLVLQRGSSSSSSSCPLEKLVITYLNKLKEIKIPQSESQSHSQSHIHRGGVVQAPSAAAFFFRRLSYLEIYRCNGLKSFLRGGGACQLPSLVELVLEDCWGLECVVSEEEEEEEEAEMMMTTTTVAFPSLARLYMCYLPELRRICGGPLHHQVLPSLESLSVAGCRKLKKLPPLAPPPNNKLKEIICNDREWWEGLEWDDNNDTKSSLLDLVQFRWRY